MHEIDFYKALKKIRNTEEPIIIIFMKLSLSMNKGGKCEILKNVL